MISISAHQLNIEVARLIEPKPTTTTVPMEKSCMSKGGAWKFDDYYADWRPSDFVTNRAYWPMLLERLFSRPMDFTLKTGCTGIDVFLRYGPGDNDVFRHDDVWPKDLGRVLCEAFIESSGDR